jgi:hypothetical protein
MARNTVVEGWTIFERWASRYVRLSKIEPFGFALSNSHEIEKHVLELNDDPAFDPEFYTDASADEARALEKVAFLRDYLADLSYDGGDFCTRVKMIIKHQNRRFCTLGYGVWFRVDDFHALIERNNLHFNGYEVGLFCRAISEIDFLSVMEICPFEVLTLRNASGADWKKEELKQVRTLITEDFLSDSVRAKLTLNFNLGPVAQFLVRITNPRKVYFDYSRSQ